MKKFDLQAALTGAKVVTRDGREVKIIGYFEEIEHEQKLIAIIKGKFYEFSEDGRFYIDKSERCYDLFLADPEPNITMVTKDTTLGELFKIINNK